MNNALTKLELKKKNIHKNIRRYEDKKGLYTAITKKTL